MFIFKAIWHKFWLWESKWAKEERASVAQARENILAFLLTAPGGIFIICTSIFICLESVH